MRSTFLLLLLILPATLLAQKGRSGMPQSPTQLLAEALHQAVALETIPEGIQPLLKRDTLHVRVSYFTEPDTIGENFSGFLPKHTDRWWVSEISPAEIKQKCASEFFFYLYREMAWLTQTKMSVTVFHQPCSEDFDDRPALQLIFELEDDAWQLKSVRSFYG
ncbi:MAG: hypothetical protein WEF53_11210 [Bacteroidota bacterium]